MASFEPLSVTQHHNLRLLADNNIPHFVPIITSEFFEAASSSPILFTKSETGEFFVGIVLSMKAGEPPIKTLAERGGFNPLSLQCSGFYISDQHIVIDRDSPRFSTTEGDELFTASQQPADCLRKVQQAIGKLHTGLEKTQAFIKTMMDNQLIEPIDLTFNFDNGERLSLKGLYTISLDSLNQLDDTKVIEFFRLGYLELAYSVASSLKQFNSLAHLRNQRIAK